MKIKNFTEYKQELAKLERLIDADPPEDSVNGRAIWEMADRLIEYEERIYHGTEKQT